MHSITRGHQIFSKIVIKSKIIEIPSDSNLLLMTPSQIFQLCNTFVLPAWLLLIIAPKWKWTGRIVVGIVVAVLAMIYIYFIVKSIGADDLGSFGSLEGVMALFTQPQAVLAGWIHYLAFDLMVGWFITKDAIKNNINRFLIIPCLLFTFMLGPSGLLLYLLLRLVITKQYFQD